MLIEAISQRNLALVTNIIKSNAINVNKVVHRLLDKNIDGPLLLLAIRNLDQTMIDFLVGEFGADVNQEIKIEGKPSTLLIYAMRCLAGYTFTALNGLEQYIKKTSSDPKKSHLSLIINNSLP